MANLLSNTKLGANAVISADTMSLDFIVSAPWDNTNNVSILTAYNSNNNLTWSSSGTRVVTLTSSPIVAALPLTYSITGPSSIDEGSTATFTVTTTNVPDSTTLYYTLTNSSDFSTSSGSFNINSNSGSFTVTPTADAITEGAETFQIQIRTESVSGTIVSQTGNITINDTSIDPSWVQQAKLTSSNNSGSDRFGERVAIDGDTAVVGAYFYDTSGGVNSPKGAAYVFTRSGSTWTQRAMIQSNDIAVGDYFGITVAISGNTIIVGAQYEDGSSSSATNYGSVYVFTGSGSSWTQQAKLVDPNPSTNDWFGSHSIAISGNTIVLGSILSDDTATNSGTAHIYTRSGSTWTYKGQLESSDVAAYDRFGAGIAIDGDTILIGAYGEGGSGTSRGAAYVFTSNNNWSSWSQQAKLTASDAQDNDYFGRGLDLDGDTAVIGAFGEDDTGSNSGSAYVFTRSGTTWSQQQKLTASDSAANFDIGLSVAIEGDTIALGSRGADSDTGAVYIFKLSGSTWTEEEKLVSDEGAQNDDFGERVSFSSNYLIAATKDEAAFIFNRT
jgi:hypothetical protein